MPNVILIWLAANVSCLALHSNYQPNAVSLGPACSKITLHQPKGCFEEPDVFATRGKMTHLLMQACLLQLPGKCLYRMQRVWPLPC